MSMSKAVLIFGAGLNQITLIEAANELGLISVVLDPNEDAPGRNLASSFFCVAGNDYEKTKSIALKHNVSAIVTSQMEKPMRLMARLAQELELLFHTPEVTEKSLDKWLMKEALNSHDVPCARGKLFSSNQIIEKKHLDDFIYPLIIKPKDATSSQGVFKIVNYEEVKIHRKTTESFSINGSVIIEEFLDGPELSVESITYQGQTNIVQYTEKFITPFPYTVEMAHLQPAPLTTNEMRRIDEVVIAAIKAIGIDNSASHAEVKLTKDGPKIIEIGARLGGDYISSYLTLHSCGVNMDKAAIRVALGLKPDLRKLANKFSYIKYFKLPAGKRVKEVNDWKEILNEPGVVFANITFKPGDEIPHITESSKRPGFVVVEGESRSQVMQLGHECANRIIEKISLG